MTTEKLIAELREVQEKRFKLSQRHPLSDSQAARLEKLMDREEEIYEELGERDET